MMDHLSPEAKARVKKAYEMVRGKPMPKLKDRPDCFGLWHIYADCHIDQLPEAKKFEQCTHKLECTIIAENYASWYTSIEGKHALAYMRGQDPPPGGWCWKKKKPYNPQVVPISKES